MAWNEKISIQIDSEEYNVWILSPINSISVTFVSEQSFPTPIWNLHGMKMRRMNKWDVILIFGWPLILKPKSFTSKCQKYRVRNRGFCWKISEVITNNRNEASQRFSTAGLPQNHNKNIHRFSFSNSKWK